MIRFKWFNLIFLAVLFFSCGKKLPELQGIDKKAWIEDKKGCLKNRSNMIGSLTKEKEKLLALDEMKIVALLGKPDENELFKRNQKFFYYYLHPAKECSVDTASVVLKLVIRFNAMGLAKEVSIE